MSNPSIASKLMTLVKGIFGQKETAPAAQPAATGADTTAEARTEEAAAAAADTEKPAAAASGEAVAEQPAEPADPAESGESGESAQPAEPADTVERPAEEEETEKAAEQDKGTVSAEADGEAADDKPELVKPEEKAAIAEELDAAEATTQVASDEVLEKVRKSAAPSADELAVPNYDDLTLPSIRARLRKLTVEQVRDLRAYEVAHGERPEFIKMYDNRIAKLQAESAE
ncbi:MAG: hypothetical protein M0026_01050 [Nocardiopsaceae bacterium]|nr:hypothetical protein [Nocardiopsaceae bacterium]